MGELLAEPYSMGVAGKLEKATMASAGSGTIVLLLAEFRGSRRLGRLGSVLALVGSMLGRWMVYKAGFQSAASPKYTVQPQREHVTQSR
jgi:hypothetical protein